jgi:hypothetical protein
VVINGQNSSEVWSSHRVARRAYPQRLRASRSDGQLVVSCAHDGYKRLAGRPIHQRKWRCGTNFLEITDHISGQADTACASLHFHPAVQLAKATDNSFVAAIDHASIMLTVDGAQATLGRGKYHP